MISNKALLVAGTTVHKGTRRVNIHFISTRQVHYGLYDSEALDACEQCIGLFRCDKQVFIQRMNKELNAGAAVYSVLSA